MLTWRHGRFRGASRRLSSRRLRARIGVSSKQGEEDAEPDDSIRDVDPMWIEQELLQMDDEFPQR